MTIVIVFWGGVCDTVLVMKNNTTPNTMEAFVAVMAKYQGLTLAMRNAVRRATVIDMEESGQYEEIGSSDVNCHLFDLYRQLGSFEKIIVNAVDLM
jgi:hypothetical protein